MGLRIQHISLQNFRNYTTFELNPSPTTTILVGPNASGKTNCIEAIQLLTALTSFRNPRNDHLLNNPTELGKIEAFLTDGNRELTLSLTLNEGKKTYFLNKKRKNTPALRGLLPAILFTPDDLALIKGSQSIKRHALDVLGAQLSATYEQISKDYEKILRQKNRYLKEQVSLAYLTSINEVLATIGAQLYELRARLVQVLTPYIKANYQTIAHHDEDIEITYTPSWKKYLQDTSTLEAASSAHLLRVMTDYFQKEQERHLSLFGPHADTITFLINGRDAQQFASQGQQRSLVLAYKMAEVAVIRDTINQQPVLLLDDVMSELDDARRNELISLISHDTQTFITSTHLGYFPQDFLDQAKLYRYNVA